MCCGCRQSRSKSEMVRLYLTPDLHVKIDESGKAGGRGVYLCRNEQCVKRALKSGAISRGLKQNVSAEEIERVTQQIQGIVDAGELQE